MSDTDGFAARQASVAARAATYLRDRLPVLPQHRAVAGHLAAATVLVVGAQALEPGTAGTTLDIECVLAPAEAAVPRPGEGTLDVLDPGTVPPTQWRVRSDAWLTARLGTPEGLWLHQRAVSVRDPGDRLAAAVRQGLAGLRARLPALVSERYNWLRTALERSDGSRDALARRILLGRGVEAALELPLLARGEPYPPPEWLPWHVARVCPQGEEILDLCGRLLAAPVVDRDAAAALRRLEDDLLEVGGHGETVVRNHWSRV